MSARKGGGHLKREQQIAIGAEVAKARAAGMSWKVLSRIYNRNRASLDRYQALAAADPKFCDIIAEFCDIIPASETGARSISLRG